MTNQTMTAYIGHLTFIERPAAAPLVGLDRCLIYRDPDTNELVQDGAFTPKPQDRLYGDTVAAACFGGRVEDLGLDVYDHEADSVSRAEVTFDPTSGRFRATVDSTLLERPGFVDQLIRSFELPADGVDIEPYPSAIEHWLEMAGLTEADAFVRYNPNTSRLEVVHRTTGEARVLNGVTGEMELVR